MHQNIDIRKAAGELTVEEHATEANEMRLQWLGQLEWMPTIALRSNSSGTDHRGREEGQMELHSGIDAVSRELLGMTKWQEVVKGWDTW